MNNQPPALNKAVGVSSQPSNTVTPVNTQPLPRHPSNKKKRGSSVTVNPPQLKQHMKHITNITACGLLLAGTINGEDPAIPVGSLRVNQDTVREGITPTLSWNITYPSAVTTVVDIDPVNEEIVTKTKLRVQVFVIGVGITDQSGREYPAKSLIHYSSSGWKHIFTGTGSEVDPERIYDDRIVKAGETLRFAARLNMNGYGYYYNNSNNVKIMMNGDLPPSNAAGYSHQTSAAEYLRPYIKNGKLALGPLDIIYAAELTHSDSTHHGFDLQDTIILVRFTKIDE